MAAELAARETGGDQRVRVDQVTIDASGMVEAQLCVDFYDYDDLPGHPSISCGRSMTYLAMLAPGGWITTRVQPVLIDCFVDWPPETTLPGEAEVGLPIPRWNDANRLAGSGPLRP